MSFSSEIRARLGLDTSAFSAGLGRVVPQVEKLGDEVARTLQRKLGAGDVFRGLLQGLGIGSAQQIADKIIAPFRTAAEDAQKLADITARVAESNIQRARESLSAADKLQLMAQDRVRLERELADLSSRGTLSEEEKRRTLELQLEINKAISAEKQLQQAADASSIAATNEAIANDLQRREDFKAWMAERDAAAARAQRAILETQQTEQAAAASRAERARAEREIARDRMTSEERVRDLAREKADVQKQLNELLKIEREGYELTVEGNQQVVELKKRQLDLETRITAEMKKQVTFSTPTPPERGAMGGGSFGRGAMFLLGGDRTFNSPADQLASDEQLRRSTRDQINSQLLEFENRSRAAMLRESLRGQGFGESAALQQQISALRDRLGNLDAYLFNPNYRDALGLGRLAEQMATVSGQTVDYQKRSLEELSGLRRLFETGNARTASVVLNPRG